MDSRVMSDKVGSEVYLGVVKVCCLVLYFFQCHHKSPFIFAP